MSGRLIMDIDLPHVESIRDIFDYREVRDFDCDEIGELDLETIKGTVEYGGETAEETIEDMRLTFKGKYGKFIPEASFLIEHENKIVSACLFVLSNEEQIPLLAYVMTDPNFQNEGRGKFLISESLKKLYSLGYQKAFLAVKEGNTSAIESYKKLGFRFRGDQ